MHTIDITTLAHVSGGASLGNTLRAGAVAGMGLVTGELSPHTGYGGGTSGITTSQGGSSIRAPFQPLALPGGGMATFK